MDYARPSTPTRVAERSGLRRVALLLGVSAIAVLAPLIVLHNAGIRLGQGSFAYRYSPLYGYRVVRAFPTILVAAAAAWVIWWLCTRPKQRRLGVALLGVVVALLVSWTWWAPPQPVLQHTFNFISPSHDGAFVIEALHADRPSAYLRGFQHRLALGPEKLKGTRVLSNPPGMTLVAMGAARVLPPNPKDPPALDRYALSTPPGVLHTTAWPTALRVALAALAMWGLGGAFAYLLGREFLSAPGAAVFTLIVMFNPSTVLFSPGKDPGQLLTVNAMLWAALAGWRRNSIPLALAAGGILFVGMLIGLIHAWIALGAAVAVAWHAWRTQESLVRLLVRWAVPGAVGASLVVVAVRLVSGWNPIAGLLAVQQSFAKVQPMIAVDHRLWLLIGLPIFLLFTSPAFWTTAALNVRRLRRGDGFGRRLFICTLGAMAATYVIGVPYELPRLWVVFLPPLALGAMIDLPMFHAERSPQRVWRPLAMIVAVQILFTALHWTIFDVRESEYRLISERLWS